MGKLEQARSYLAQGIIQSLLENNDVKSCILFHKDKISKKKVLNEKTLRLFLNVYSSNNRLFKLVKKLNKEKYQLPDVLCLAPKTNTPFFHEVKSIKNHLKLSDLAKSQRKAIKIIANAGYTVHITNMHFLIELNEDEAILDYSNKEEGMSFQEEIPKVESVTLKMARRSIKEANHKNIYIEELEVKDYLR